MNIKKVFTLMFYLIFVISILKGNVVVTTNKYNNSTIILSPNLEVVFFTLNKDNYFEKVETNPTLNLIPNLEVVFGTLNKSKFKETSVIIIPYNPSPNLELIFKEINKSKQIEISKYLFPYVPSPNLQVIFKEFNGSKQKILNYFSPFIFSPNLGLVFFNSYLEKIVNSYSYKVDAPSRKVNLTISTFWLLPNNPSIKILWGDGSSDTLNNLAPSTQYNLTHIYSQYKRYNIKIQGYNDNNLAENYSIQINLQHYGQGYLSYSYEIDNNLNMNLTLTIKIRLYSDVINELNVSHETYLLYYLYDSQNNLLKNERINLTLLRQSGTYDFQQTLNLTYSFLIEDNYTWHVKIYSNYPDAINKPFLFETNFTIEVKPNVQGGNQQTGGGGLGNTTYEGMFSGDSNTGIEYKGINLSQVTYESLFNASSNYLGQGISYLVNYVIPSFVDFLVKMALTWEGLGLLTGVIIITLAGIHWSSIFLGFIIIWELIGYFLYSMNMIPLGMSVLVVNYFTEIFTSLLVIIISYLIITFLRKND